MPARGSRPCLQLAGAWPGQRFAINVFLSSLWAQHKAKPGGGAAAPYFSEVRLSITPIGAGRVEVQESKVVFMPETSQSIIKLLIVLSVSGAFRSRHDAFGQDLRM